MDETQVALQRQADGSYRELGVILERTGNDIAVLDETGSTTTLSKRGLMTPPFGSVNHLLRARPEQLSALAQEDPTRVAKQLVADAASGISARDLRAKLVEAGSADVTDGDWKRVVSELKTDEEVKASGKPVLYKLARGVGASLLPLPRASAPSTTEPAQAPAVIDVSEEQVIAPVPSDTAGPVTIELELVRFINAAETGIGAVADLGAVTRALLPIAAALTSKQVDQLEKLDVTDLERSLTTALLLARGRKLANGAPLPTASLVRLVFGQATHGGDSKIQRTAGVYAEHAVPAVPDWSADSLHDVARSLARWSGGNRPHRVIEVLLDAYAEALPTFSDTDLERGAYRDIAQIAQHLPLRQAGSRARLIAALGRRSTVAVVDQVWWGDDFSDLVELAGGVAGATLMLPEVADAIARPRVTERLANALSRQTLSVVIGAPHALARHATPDAVGSAWSRVAGTDPVAERWLHHMQDRSRQVELENAQRRAEAQTVVETERAARLEKQLMDHSQQLTRLTRQLANASESRDAVNAAGLEQGRMDVLKSLANVAALALDAAAAQQDRALVQKVVFQTAREGLEVGSELGAEVPYNPVIHDSLGEVIEAGSAVVVTRRGYDLIQATGDRLVLLKSHVVER